MCEPSLSDSSTFLYLDMLADILMQDSLEMESDFTTKLKFLKEQEHICLDNAQNALPVVETLKSVNHIMLRVEMELHENEINLIEAEKAVTKLEQSYPSPEILAGQTYPLASTTYQDLLSMLMSTKKTADQCNQIKEEVATYNEQISAQVPSVNLVTKLIDCHNNTLESMEKQIEKLQNQVTQVQKEFELLNKEYESQFHAMCPCKKIKELKRKDTTEVRLRM